MLVDADAEYNARQPASIIITIKIINHEGSPGMLRDRKERTM